MALLAEREDTESDVSDLDIDFNKLAEAIKAMEHDGWGEDEDEAADAAALEADLRHSIPQDSNDWYPFKKKEVSSKFFSLISLLQVSLTLLSHHSKHVVALLIIGSTRSILSRSQYHRIRAILHICDVRLPEWGALRALSKNLKENLGLVVSQRKSPGGTPLFGLKVQTIISNVRNISST
jgi:hypothetical protein